MTPPVSTIYLVPCVLHEGAVETIPPYVIDAVKKCTVIFAEQERTARRFFKSIWKEIVIDDYEWFAIHKAEEEQLAPFRQKIREGKNIAIISEAGCPGVADPGQVLIGAAQALGAVIKPLVGPSAILLALMASGMNGQQFSFTGYLPIDDQQRTKAIQDIEGQSRKTNGTYIFIETPYRNNALISALLQTCQPATRLCIAADITGPAESIITRSISDWRKSIPDLHKRPVIFLLQA